MTEQQLADAVVELAHLLGWSVAHFRPAGTAKGWVTPVAYDGQGFPDLTPTTEEISGLTRDGTSGDRSGTSRTEVVEVAEPVGLAEIAGRLGTKVNTVHAWHKRGVLPPSRWVVSGSPAWTWEDVERWAQETGHPRAPADVRRAEVVERAVELLGRMLAGGPIGAREVAAAAAEAGISPDCLSEARDALGVVRTMERDQATGRCVRWVMSAPVCTTARYSYTSGSRNQ